MGNFCGKPPPTQDEYQNVWEMSEKDSENTDSVIIWASSGGGWRAQAASIGFANLFGRAGLLPTADSGRGKAKKIEIISTNSGASWFSTQFFYSKNFHKRVMTVDDGDDSAATMGNLVHEWMKKYAEYQLHIETHSVGGKIAYDIGKDTPIPPAGWFEKYTQGLELLVHNNVDWAEFVTGMMDYVAKNAYDDDKFKSVLATPKNRVAPLQETALLIHSSLVPQTRLNGKLYSLGPKSKEGYKYTGVLSVAYCVDKDGAEYQIAGNHDKTDPLQVYQSDKDFLYEEKHYEEYGIYPKRPETLIPTGDTKVGAFKTKFFGGKTSATQVASISSAAVGGFSPSNPSLFAQSSSKEISTFNEIEKIGARIAAAGLFNHDAMKDLSVPTQWPKQGDKLDGRFVDGGTSDNTALIQSIAYYQSKDGADLKKTLRIILSNNDTNKGIHGNDDEIVKFFKNDSNKDIPTGESIWCDCLINPQASPQIFKEAMTIKKFKSETVKIPMTSDTVTVGNFLTNCLKGTTIANPLWGIKGGQTVEILVIATDADIPTGVIGSGITNEYMQPLKDLAMHEATNASLLQLVNNFVDGKGPIAVKLCA